MEPWEETWDWRSWAEALGGHENDVARAHLAAASPDLYRACAALLDASGSYEEIQHVRALAERAMKKASGDA
jgi:hypothetical protein